MKERPFCARCSIKHLGQSRALMLETLKGYPLHCYYAIGHMSEAEDEIVALMPEEANAIRDERLKLEDGLRTGKPYTPDFPRLMLLVAEGAMLEETQIQETEQ